MRILRNLLEIVQDAVSALKKVIKEVLECSECCEMRIVTFLKAQAP